MLVFNLSIYPAPLKSRPKPVTVLWIISQGKMELLESCREATTCGHLH